MRTSKVADRLRLQRLGSEWWAPVFCEKDRRERHKPEKKGEAVNQSALYDQPACFTAYQCMSMMMTLMIRKREKGSRGGEGVERTTTSAAATPVSLSRTLYEAARCSRRNGHRQQSHAHTHTRANSQRESGAGTESDGVEGRRESGRQSEQQQCPSER